MNMENPVASDKKMNRRKMLKLAALSIPAMGITSSLIQASQQKPGIATLPKNVIIFLTDQERATQHFPPNWEVKNLPGLTRLKRNGLTFKNAFTNACMCSPARTTFMSGYFPAQHGVKYTVEQNMPLSTYPDQFSMPFPPGTADLTPQPNSTSIDGDGNGDVSGANITLPNIATVATACGFNAVYKGKWHCAKPLNGNGTWVPEDLSQYGFSRWNPQDAGANQNVSEAGGAPSASTSTQNHDTRFMFDDGNMEDGKEGVLAYLKSQATSQQPFFLFISLVNPHDVLAYPNNMAGFGYDDAWLKGDIRPPATVNEDLSTKPTSQKQYLDLTNFGMGGKLTDDQQIEYLNFYGNLMKLQDGYLRNVLETLDSLGLTDDTLIIRTADHGEMGMAHGGMIQKNFNFYEEAAKVPLVYSNPKMFPNPRVSNALVSHVDFLPTLAGLYKAPSGDCSDWAGVDYSSLVLDRRAEPVQDYIVFTYDDYRSGQASNTYPRPLNHIVGIREARWKLAEYYDPTGANPSQYEMYDLKSDPLETKNLVNHLKNSHNAFQFDRLQLKLDYVKYTRLQPLEGGYYLTSFY